MLIFRFTFATVSSTALKFTKAALGPTLYGLFFFPSNDAALVAGSEKYESSTIKLPRNFL